MRRLLITLAAGIVLASGPSSAPEPSADDTLQVPPADAKAAADLVAERRANARRQHEGRPAMWMFAHPPQR